MADNIPEVIPRIEYEQVNWEDAPSINTPLSADNLNNMDTAIASLFADLAVVWDIVKDLDIEEIRSAVASITGKADLASPAFTGTPTAPTPDYGDDSTQIATTEFVENGFRPLWVDMGTISSLPAEKAVEQITDDMICTAFEIGSPSAKKSDWSVVTGDGTITVSGTISGSTTLILRLEKVISV